LLLQLLTELKILSPVQNCRYVAVEAPAALLKAFCDVCQHFRKNRTNKVSN
jgi:hypothetical protein